MSALTRPRAKQESNCSKDSENIINNGVKASPRKSQVRFRISFSAVPRVRLDKFENLPVISLAQLQPHQ